MQRQLLDLISGLVADAAEAGARYDKTFEALASCRVHALAVAGGLAHQATIDSSTSSGPESPRRAAPRPTARIVPPARLAEPMNIIE